ncbi:hypothetical protein N7E70_015805 [Aminobacter sp. NyZ550]|uniref:hypothetical protein n=1 Tax=Aminobacter sp. NyZ550 TaxID=2979870 RepID=UPI0021D5988D|nr:hypothetical protein [Aminobacter sp. NyZ550]WAX93162.1 hypothetical protein N7E70_015805 [Aminobacter sp. NyZ550]
MDMSAREKLEKANAAISMAAMMLASVAPTLEEFMRECRDMESVGVFLKPSLFMDPERRATEALMKPLYQAALSFTQTYKTQLAAAAAGALEKVNAHG